MRLDAPQCPTGAGRGILIPQDVGSGGNLARQAERLSSLSCSDHASHANAIDVNSSHPS